jgi:hypothetical protein
MPAVTITAAPLTIEELLEVARGARVELGPDARALIGASRAVVDAALASGRLHTRQPDRLDVQGDQSAVWVEQRGMAIKPEGWSQPP